MISCSHMWYTWERIHMAQNPLPLILIEQLSLTMSFLDRFWEGILSYIVNY